MYGFANVALLPLGAAVLGVALYRARKYRLPGLRSAVLQVVSILVVVGAWFAVRTAAYLAGPPDADLYAQTWAFQAIVFVLVYLPWVMLGAGALVLAESIFFRLRNHAL